MSSRRRNVASSVVAACVALALGGAVSPLTAQTVDTSCSYARCGLGIVPRLSALDVVRGDREERVGSLAFLLPHDVRAAFAGSEPAQRRAGRALGLRRVGAVLTATGGALAVAGAVHAVSSRSGRTTWAVGAGIGAAAFAASVPVHFAADAELSRAVWEYNRGLANRR